MGSVASASERNMAQSVIALVLEPTCIAESKEVCAHTPSGFLFGPGKDWGREVSALIRVGAIPATEVFLYKLLRFRVVWNILAQC